MGGGVLKTGKTPSTWITDIPKPLLSISVASQSFPSINIPMLQDASYLFGRIQNIRRIGNISLPTAITTESMFQSSQNLEEVGRVTLKNDPTLNMTNMFYDCIRLQRTQWIDCYGNATRAFQGCSSLDAFPLRRTSIIHDPIDGQPADEEWVYLDAMTVTDIFKDTRMSFPNHNNTRFLFFSIELPNATNIDGLFNGCDFVRNRLALPEQRGTTKIIGSKITSAKNLFGSVKVPRPIVGTNLQLDMPAFSDVNNLFTLLDAQKWYHLTLNMAKLKYTGTYDIYNIFGMNMTDTTSPQNKCWKWYIYVPPRLPDGTINGVWAMLDQHAGNPVPYPQMNECALNWHIGTVDIEDICKLNGIFRDITFLPEVQCTITDIHPDIHYWFTPVNGITINCIGLNAANKAVMRSRFIDSQKYDHVTLINAT